MLGFFLQQSYIGTVDYCIKGRLKNQNHSSVTSPCEQTAWFITLGCEQQSVKFQAFVIGNQDVIERLEQNKAGSQRIGTVTVFGFAQQHLLFGMLLHVLVYPTPALWNFNCIGTMGFTSKKQKRKYMHWVSFKQGRDQASLLWLLLSCVSHMQPSSSASFDLHHDLKSQHLAMIGKFVWCLVGIISSLQVSQPPIVTGVELATCSDARGTPILCQALIPCLQYALIACMIYISTRLHNFRLNLYQNFR